MARDVRFRGAPRLQRVAYEPAASPAAAERSASDDHATAWGGAFARFEDLDQNSFALVSFDEISRAVEAQRQAAAERRETERRAAHELEIARRVQARLFPQRLPELESLEYAGACVQTHQVGGDCYDLLDLGQARDEEFGEERLLDVLRGARDLSPSDIVANVFEEVRRFSGDQQRDDVTLIVARCRSPKPISSVTA